MLNSIISVIVYSVSNRARGSRFYNLTNSTVVGRLLSTAIMAATTAIMAQNLYVFLWLWASLMLWATPKWDEYWSAELGNEPNHSKMWGLLTMGLRQSLAAIAIIGVCYILGTDAYVYALFTPVLAVYYLIFGSISKSIAIPYSEHCVGATLGLLITQCI